MNLENVDQSSNAYNDLIGQTPAAFVLQSYTVANLPSAARWKNGLIIVSNETGGLTVAFSDSVNWRRVQDRAIVS
jgi:hypothetical protein